MDTSPARCPLHTSTPRPPLPTVDFFDPAFKAAAHAAYAQLREHAPVARTVFADGRPLWLVTRHADVLAVLKDPRFVKNQLATLTPDEIAALPKLPAAMKLLTGMLLGIDPPVHTRQRRLIMQAFSPRLVEALRPQVQAIVDALLVRPLETGAIELVEEFAFPLPITVIAALLGLPLADQPRFRAWSNVIATNAGLRSPAALATIVPAVEGLAAYLRALFEHKRASPADDLITHLLTVRDGGDALTEDEIISLVLLLIVAGHETTAHLIGNGMLALLRHPDQMARLRADPSLLPAAVEELLRYDGPVETSTLRYPVEDVTLGGATIPRGQLVLVVLASANRDAQRFEAADALDLGRTPSGHLAFGHGLHFCLGAALARLEAEVAFGTLLRALHGVRLAVSERDLRWRVGTITRGLQKLPLVFAKTPPMAPARGAGREPSIHE